MPCKHSCISVECPSHMYICDTSTVTHVFMCLFQIPKICKGPCIKFCNFFYHHIYSMDDPCEWMNPSEFLIQSFKSATLMFKYKYKDFDTIKTHKSSAMTHHIGMFILQGNK